MQKITFHINYKTKWGERLIVVGNIPSLGNGRIEHSLDLEYQADGNWATTLKITETAFDYQYVVIDDNWNILAEEWGEMRTFESEVYKKGSKISLKDSWRGKYHPENALNNAAFLKVIFNPRKYKSPKAKKTSQQPRLQFQIRLESKRGKDCAFVEISGNSETGARVLRSSSETKIILVGRARRLTSQVQILSTNMVFMM
jgi:hypothetical protein